MFSSSKLTEGALYFGMLSQTAYLADLSKGVIPLWLFIGLVILPCCVHAVMPREELPGSWGRRMHLVATWWYLVLASFVGSLCLSGYRPEGWAFS
jgi:hypothetical protein